MNEIKIQDPSEEKEEEEERRIVSSYCRESKGKGIYLPPSPPSRSPSSSPSSSHEITSNYITSTPIHKTTQ